MHWLIERVINYHPNKLWGQGYAQFGFPDASGNRYTLSFEDHWIGRVEGDSLIWTVGPTPVPGSQRHTIADIAKPTYLTTCPDGALLVTSSGNCRAYRVTPDGSEARPVIDGQRIGISDLGNFEYDGSGDIWANEVLGCRVWHLSGDGQPLQVIGSEPGPSEETAAFAAARFGPIFDLRRGPDGLMYVLDSGNYCVRRLDPSTQQVVRVVGTGMPGYGGDGGDALSATLGSTPRAKFDGPWSLAFDEIGDMFIGDTQNHVVRMVERRTNIITTIAGTHAAVPGRRNDPTETDPLHLNLPLICSLDSHGGRLFIPEWDGDLIILARR